MLTVLAQGSLCFSSTQFCLHLAGPLACLAQVRCPRRVTFLQQLLLSHGRWEAKFKGHKAVRTSQPPAILHHPEQGANSCVHRETRCWRGQEVKEGFLYSCILQGKDRFRFQSVFWVIRRQSAMGPGTLPSLCFVLFFSLFSNQHWAPRSGWV